MCAKKSASKIVKLNPKKTAKPKKSLRELRRVLLIQRKKILKKTCEQNSRGLHIALETGSAKDIAKARENLVNSLCKFARAEGDHLVQVNSLNAKEKVSEEQTRKAANKVVDNLIMDSARQNWKTTTARIEKELKTLGKKRNLSQKEKNRVIALEKELIFALQQQEIIQKHKLENLGLEK